MTSQVAITLLKSLEQSLDSYCELNDEGKTAFSMAISALEPFGNSEQLPSVQPELSNNSPELDNKNGESISRQAAIDLVKSFYKIDKSVLKIMVFKLKQLPSAQPREGEWICQEDDDIWNCSECDFEIDGTGCVDPLEYLKSYKFCPNCGCRMEEGDSDEKD